jgi:hypothetical protein
MQKLRAWFLRNWFAGIYVILGGVWLATTIAYLTGAKSITFGNRYGQKPTIDFMREHERTVVGLADGLGLELAAGGPKLHGSVVKLRAGLPIVCWVCGDFDEDGGIGQVDFRQGDWFFRAPTDLSKNSQLKNGREEWVAAMRTIAWNRATAERVQVGIQDSLGAQEAELEKRGLVRSPATALSAETIADLETVSMQREGCVIYNAAFVAAALLWLVIGGPIWLVVWLRRRKSAQP